MMLARLRVFYVHHIKRADASFVFFIYWLLLLLSLFDASYVRDSLTDQSTSLAYLLHFLVGMFNPIFLFLVIVVFFWARELRFWDVRIYLKKNNFYQLDIGKIKEWHLDNVNFLIFLTALGAFNLFNQLLSIMEYYWFAQLFSAGGHQ